MKKKDEYKSKDDIELVVHLEGKSSNSQLISLDDLTNLAAGINGLTHQIIKNKVGKARTSEQIKNLCLLGISKIKKGSAVLQISARQIGQLKIGLDTENILSDVIESMNKIENNDITSIDSQIFPYLDLITKPLTSENSKLNIDLYSKSKKIATSNTFTYGTRKKIQKAFINFRIHGGIIHGILTEINVKTNSFQVQTLLKLERFFYDSQEVEKIISLLRKNVEVTFNQDTNTRTRRLIEIKEIGIKSTDKGFMTVKDFKESGLIGKLSFREDIKNSSEYSKTLREDVFK